MAAKCIRPAEPQDHSAILALAKGVAQEGDAFQFEATVSEEELSFYWLPEPKARVESYVALGEDDSILGVYVLHPASGGRGAHIAHGSFLVDQAGRGRGLGKELCAHSVRLARERGYAGMRLNMVVATNTPAVRVCKACGFQVMCTMPGVFSHPTRGMVDAHVMFHNLEDLGASSSAPRRASQVSTVEQAAPTLAYSSASCTVGQEVRLQPRLGQAAAGEFSVEPALPAGLTLDASTGVISGSPSAPIEETTFRVRGAFEACITLHVEEPAPPTPVVTSVGIDEDFAARLENVTDVADLLPEPTKTRTYGDWMVWMVHRAWLNDPSLVDFCFNNMHMPPGHIEPRIAPKLMAALAWNTHIEVLSLSNSSMQRAEVAEMSASLRRNTTLVTINLESNWLDSTAVRELALAIKDNREIPLEQFRVSHQKQMGRFFGRPTEEAIGQMMSQSERILKLGFECQDAHWRNLIDRGLLRNNDAWRRRQATAEAEHVPAAEECTLGHVLLRAHPGAPATEFFPPEKGAVHVLYCGYVAQTGRLPTSSQLQSCAKNSGSVLPYNVAGPLVRDCRSWILNRVLKSEVVVTDAFGTDIAGTLHGWSEEVNGQWMMDVWGEDGRRRTFRSNKEPGFWVSDAWVPWLQAPARAAVHAGG
mmetsp:Transcript_651/g.1597  ORF Transcript_651/g.1597 Transcript_651/m.1597 type:complete len:647 (+) Transcript_651:56-1996(+)